MEKLRNQKGISLVAIIIIIVVVIFFIAMMSGGSNNGGSSSYITNKEDRSTYIAKCKTIAYDTLARNPDQYKGNDYTFTGEVIQVLEGSNNTVDLRVNVTRNDYTYSDDYYYSDTIYVTYQYSNSNESRILEDDIITFYGSFAGIYSYESVMGSQVSIPMINAMYIDIK